MREIVFRVLAERSGHLEAKAETLPIRITAPTLEELQLSVAEPIRWVLSPLHEPLLPPVKTGVVHAAGLAGFRWPVHRGCSGIRRLH